jgi:BASS family bile acid:Na+ symporter
MLDEVLTAVTQAGVLGFVVASMVAMGLALTIERIVGALRNVRLMIMLLAANFVAVPAVAVAAARLLPMDDATGTALVIYGCCAGAPFLPKLAQMVKGDVALSVGAMVLLMVVTVIYAPVVLPLVVQGATVDAGQIATSLIVFMLVPLAIALGVRARYPQIAAEWVGPAGQISSASLLIGVAAGLFVSWQQIVGAIGSGVFVGTAIVLAGALVAGYLAGLGGSADTSRVMMLATGQRNISAALVVAGSLGGDVIVLTLVAGIVIIVGLLLMAAEIGRRGGAAAVTGDRTDDERA